MLPRSARLTTAEEFRATVRAGVRCARPSLVVHMRRTGNPPSRAGFVVSRAIGNAVRRNRVKRRLRHLVAERLRQAPFPVDVVVRALPHPAAPLAQDLRLSWEAATTKLERP